MSNLPSILPSLAEVIGNYESKLSSMEGLLSELDVVTKNVEQSCVMGGIYTGSPFTNGSQTPHKSTMEARLLESAWKYVYKGLNIDKIASATDRNKFDLALKNPPDFTIENIRATFGDYLVNSRHHILKGLAECFSDLDPAYKSHSKVKIGVKGLPKRVIIENVLGDGSWNSYGQNKLRDTLNALRVYRSQEHLTHNEFENFLRICKINMNGISEWVPEKRYPGSSVVAFGGKMYANSGSTISGTEFVVSEEKYRGWKEIINPEPGLSSKGFKNGNMHLIFDERTLTDINKALAEFYGDVLPDTPDEAPKKKTGTSVSKDLQFYPTGDNVLDRMVGSNYHFRDGTTVLEPSCGDGRIMDYLMKLNPNVKITGVEVDASRAMECKGKGHSVLVANFLEVAPDPRFDFVIMNPPFYGLHWKKHIIHALKFLKPDGILLSVLSGSAFHDGHLEDLGVTDKGYDRNSWRDLPTASFAACGTNIPTGYVKINKRG